MSCNPCTDVLTVYQSTTRKPVIRIEYEDTDEPFDFTGFASPDEIKAIFSKAGGGVVEKLWSSGDIAILSEAGGKIRIDLEVADTALLATGERQDFEVEIMKSGETFLAPFKQAITVVERLS